MYVFRDVIMSGGNIPALIFCLIKILMNHGSVNTNCYSLKQFGCVKNDSFCMDYIN